MSALQEAEKALDEFIYKYCTCAFCVFWEKELFESKCNGPEIQCEFTDNEGAGMCEQHEFRDDGLQKRLEQLQEAWCMAWYIVEGFQFTQPFEAQWEK